MRTVTFFLAALPFFFSGCAGTGPTRADYEYQKVTRVEASAEQIYNRALAWMAERFESANHAVQLRDEDNRRIISNASFLLRTGSYTGFDVEMSLIVEAKDERFRVTGRNFRQVDKGLYDFEKPLRQSHIDDLEQKMDSLRTGLQSYIESSKSNDW